MTRKRIPKWLYHKRETDYDTTWRFGSAKPLRLCWTIMSEKPIGGYQMATTHLGLIGRLHFGYGPEDGIMAGVEDSKPRWRRYWFRKNGMTFAISWGRP